MRSVQVCISNSAHSVCILRAFAEERGSSAAHPAPSTDVTRVTSETHLLPSQTPPPPVRVISGDLASTAKLFNQDYKFTKYKISFPVYPCCYDLRIYLNFITLHYFFTVNECNHLYYLLEYVSISFIRSVVFAINVRSC